MRRWFAPLDSGSALFLLLIGVQASFAAPGAVTTELIDHHCMSELNSTELTLFANGTLRLRERIDDRKTMLLAELEPEELEVFVRRLGEVDLSEAESSRGGVGGEWVEQCALTVNLEGRSKVFLRYSRFDIVALGIKQAEGVLADLDQLGRIRALHGTLPADYDPKIGDFLSRVDGTIFEVVGFTSDNRGVELSGVNQPVTIYVSREEFRNVFGALAGDNLFDLER